MGAFEHGWEEGTVKGNEGVSMDEWKGKFALFYLQEG
jgi:hypothetical protein